MAIKMKTTTTRVARFPLNQVFDADDLITFLDSFDTATAYLESDEDGGIIATLTEELH